MLTIPVLAAPRPTSRAGGMLSSLRRGKTRTAEPDGCDPSVFADQIASYLETASQERQVHVAVIEDIRPVVHAPAAHEEMAAESPSPSFEAIRQDFDEAMTQAAAPPIDAEAQAAAYAEPVMAAGDESVSLALEEAVRALFADPVPSIDVVERPAAPSYEPQAASYADTVPFDASPRARDIEVPVTELPVAEAPVLNVVNAVNVESVASVVNDPAFDLGVSNLDVAATTLEFEAPIFEAPVLAVETGEPESVPTPAAAAAEEWAAVDELMAALQAMPLAALEVTASDEWIAPVSDRRKKSAVGADRTPEPVKPEPARAASENPPAAKDKPAAPSPANEREWVALIESLRSDVERLASARKAGQKEAPVAARVVQAPKPKASAGRVGILTRVCAFAALLTNSTR